MVCPNCGEPVMTRHLFCAVCGADLKDVKSEKLHKRLKSALKTQSAKTEESRPVNDSSPAQQTKARESSIFSDFMNNYT